MTRYIILFCCLIFCSHFSSAQIFESEVEGLGPEKWAERVVSEGQAIFSDEYEPLDESYKPYNLMIRILLGNPSPEEQLELANAYQDYAKNSGERRHILVSQMLNELLEGGSNVDYYVANGDWFTIMLARWVDANYLNRSDAKFVDLYNYYEPIVQSESEDKSYPAAMIIITDLKRSGMRYAADLPSYIRNYKENYYWMKRLYPEYDVSFVYAFDALTIHYGVFGHSSALKIIENIDQESISPINSIIMANRAGAIHLHNGDYGKASNIIESFLESQAYKDMKNSPVCSHYCPRSYAVAALSAMGLGQDELARKRYAAMPSAVENSDANYIFYHMAAKALIEMGSPSDKDIANWVKVTNNGHFRREAIQFQNLVDPNNRFSPPKESKKHRPGLLTFAALFLALGFGIWAFTGRQEKTRRLKELTNLYETTSDRAVMLDQCINDIHSVTQLSGEHTQNTLLSLERNIDNPRTLEFVDIVSKSIIKWTTELSNVVFSAKNILTGAFQQTETINFTEFESAARRRWETMGRLEKASLIFSSDNFPLKFSANRMLLDMTLDLYVQDAFSRNRLEVITVSLNFNQQEGFLEAHIHDQGNIPQDYQLMMSAKNDKDRGSSIKSGFERMIQTLSALKELGGRFEQEIGHKNAPHQITFFIPISHVEYFHEAANNN